MTVGIVYYSRTDNTRIAAKLLEEKIKARKVPAKLIEIETLKKPNFLKAEYAAFRQKELPIKNTSFDLKEFDTILIGVPIWEGRPAPVVKTFFNIAQNGKGKKIGLFVTCGGEPSSNTQAAEMMKTYAENSGFTPVDAFLPLQMMLGEIKNGAQILDHFLETVLSK